MNEPFKLDPVYKDYLWGGHRLKDDYNKDTDISPLAESWECSTHPDGECTNNNEKLSEILRNHPEFIGTHPKTENGQIPILIKFIDANKNLSIQVHPDDEFAKSFGQLGKSEMWYIIEAKEGANIIYGLNQSISKETLSRSIKKGNVEKYLQKVAVKKNDIFFINAGVIHAIGEGCLIVEIQENSNLTFRLYDYNRKDKNGKLRELHIEQALKVANLNKSSGNINKSMRVLRYKPGFASEFLCRCEYFVVERILVNTENTKCLPSIQTDELSFNVIICISGCGSLFYNNKVINFFKGDSIFIPANSEEITMHGKFQILKVFC